MGYICFILKREKRCIKMYENEEKEIDLSERGIVTIINVNRFTELLELSLCSNKIFEITGLENLVHLQSLRLHYNRINYINGLENLKELRELYLPGNRIKRISGINHLGNLHILNLDNNQINKITGMNDLINLEILYLQNNLIRIMENMDSLVNLRILSLENNKIKELDGLTNLINLEELYLHENLINTMKYPSKIMNCVNLVLFQYDDRVCVHRTIRRFFDKKTSVYSLLHVMDDEQNIHEHSISTWIDRSIKLLLADIPVTMVKSDFIQDKILTMKTKELLCNFMQCPDRLSNSELSFADLFSIIWKVIKDHPHSETLKLIMNQEMQECEDSCFTGRMNRLVNVLNGFDERVCIRISQSEEIANIIILNRRKYEDVEIVKNAVRRELEERLYSQAVIEEWVSNIE